MKRSGMKRIAIIGSGGAGKSVLARELGKTLKLEVFHLDTLYWKSGWTETPRPAWLAIQENLVKKARWIIDGNYQSTMDIRLQAADTIIFLDMPRSLCLSRVLKRSLQYRGRCRPDITPGCPESFDPEFLRWVWNYPKSKRPQVLEKLAALEGDKTIIHLRSPRAVKRFLRQLASEDLAVPRHASPARP